MNVQFGTGFTVTPSNSGAQGSDARVGVAVPVESDNQSTTSFTPVTEANESPKSRQEGADQGIQERQARSRQQQENQQDQRQLERRADDERQQARIEDAQQRADEQQQSQRGSDANDRTQEEEKAESRRQQDAQEQRQLEVEQRQVQQLADRDREVKAHEQAHQAVGGQYAGSMSLTYERGPDGKNYAIGGEVPIDTGKIANDPQATLDKAETIRRAALAPAEPSSQDRRVAAQAIQIGLEARADIQQQQQEALTSDDVNEEQTETDTLREEERLEAEQKAQQEEQAQEASDTVIADLQDLNERMARIQTQLVEASQIDDRINSKVNLLDVTT
ncbi:putative metalloprotease CJM1_0395 family protein [Pseudomonas sp. HK3]